MGRPAGFALSRNQERSQEPCPLLVVQGFAALTRHFSIRRGYGGLCPHPLKEPVP